MENKFFPNDPKKLSNVMEIYEQEVLNRREWINEAVERYNEERGNGKSPSTVINYAISIINHAMVVVRILDEKAISSRKQDKARSKERARILHERNTGLPEPPKTLRRIRNDYEHFEEKLDIWATSPNPNIYIDLTMGNLEGAIQIPDMKTQDIFRQLDGFNLIFWNNRVDLREIIQWISTVSKIVTKNKNKV